MKIGKAMKRDKKIYKRKHGHRVDGASVFLIQDILGNSSSAKKKKRRK